MGAGNVKAAFARWSHVPDPAFRLLLWMALTSLDEDQPPAFWGGRETMAKGLGRIVPYDEADWRAVSRAMSTLRDVGAVELERHSAPGQTARHVLRLAHATQDATRPLNTGRPASPDRNTGRHTSPEHRTPGDRNTGRPATEHRTPGDRTQDARRRPEEKQDQQDQSGEDIVREPDPSEPGLIELPTATSSASPIDAEFAEWYSLYPRKVARGRALKAYRAARKSVSAEVLFDAVRAQREKLVKDGEQFCPHPATWLNTERWTDAAAPSRPVASGPPRFDEIEQPPSGLSPAEYATWERGVRERRQRGAAS